LSSLDITIPNEPFILGLDCQQRGLAFGMVSLASGQYLGYHWEPLQKGTHESITYWAWREASKWVSILRPRICTIEQPTAVKSPSSMTLWSIYGAVVAGAFPFSGACESIVVPSWKAKAGLNKWAKETGLITKGFIPKASIRDGVSALLSITNTITPVDIYDALGIALGAYNRNIERVNNK
jgi:Holliday junction resolvasome RuvABC endonuclease subunit